MAFNNQKHIESHKQAEAAGEHAHPVESHVHHEVMEAQKTLSSGTGTGSEKPAIKTHEKNATHLDIPPINAPHLKVDDKHHSGFPGTNEKPASVAAGAFPLKNGDVHITGEKPPSVGDGAFPLKNNSARPTDSLGDPNNGTAMDTRKNWNLRNKLGSEFLPSESGGSDVIKNHPRPKINKGEGES